MESITFVGWPLGPLTRTVLYALTHSALISGGIFVPPPHRARYKHFRNPNSQPLSQQGSPRNSLPQTERDKALQAGHCLSCQCNNPAVPLLTPRDSRNCTSCLTALQRQATTVRSGVMAGKLLVECHRR